MNRVKTYAWVTLLRLGILVGWALTGVILGGTAWLFGREFLRAGHPAVLWAFGVAAVVSTFVLYQYGAKIAFERMAVRENPFDADQNEARAIVRYLSARRHHHVPTIAFLTSKDDGRPVTKLLRWMFAMLDRPFGRDAILIGDEGLEALDHEELKGVLAHELRHSDAMENKLRMVIIAAEIYMALLLTVGVAIHVIAACFVPGITIWDAIFNGAMAYLIMWWVGRIVKIPQALMSQATELKTDALAALDLGTGKGLVEGLKKLEAEMNRVDPTRRTRLSATWSWLMRSHPPDQLRIWALQMLQ